MAVSTSRNLTIVGISTIIGALATAIIAIFDGNPATNPDWNVVALAVVSGIGNVMAKGAATGDAEPEKPVS